MTQPESQPKNPERWPDLFDKEALESLDRRYRRGRLMKRTPEPWKEPDDKESIDSRSSSTSDMPSWRQRERDAP